MDLVNDQNTMGKGKPKKYLWKYVIAFCIPAICFVVHMIIKGCYPFGTNTILMGDASGQYYAFFLNLCDRVQNGNSIFFKWNGGLGYDYYSNFFYYLASPFNIIALCFGKKYMELGVIVTMITQIGACGVTMTYYLSHTRRNVMEKGSLNSFVCAFFGVSYAMCDYMLAYEYNIIWLVCLALAPLVILGLERLVENDDVRLYYITLLMCFVFNFYFAWFVCILSVLWFIDIKKDGIKKALKQFLKFALTSVVAAMSAAIVLVPCYYAVLTKGGEYNQKLSDFGMTYMGRLANFLETFLWGYSFDFMGSDLTSANSYQGVIVVIMGVLYVTCKNIKISTRIKRVVELVVMCVCLNWSVAIYVLHGFTIPHLLTGRFLFILTILILVSAFEYICNCEAVGYVKILLLLVIGCGAVIYAAIKSTEMQSALSYVVTIAIIIYASMLLILRRRNSISRNAVIINFMVVGIVEIIANSLYVNNDISSTSVENNTGIKYWQEVYDNIDNDNLERKTSWMRAKYSNMCSDTNLFASSMNMNVYALMKKMGMSVNYGVRYDYIGTTPVDALMFNVRNVLTDDVGLFGGYTGELSHSIDDDTYDIHENYGVLSTEYALGAGYMVSDNILNVKLSETNPFSSQNSFIEGLSGVDDVFTVVSTDEFSDIQIDYNLCSDNENSPLQKTNNVLTYVNEVDRDGYYPSISYSFTVERDMELYMRVQDKNNCTLSVSVDDEDIVTSGGTRYLRAESEIVYFGKLTAGQKINMYLSNFSDPGETGVTYVSFYEYNDEKMQQCLDSLKDEVLNIDTFEDTYVKGTITVKEDGILYTSIPYYKGFTAYVDGEKADIVGLLDGAFIGLNLTSGEHTIELRYITYGFWPGLIISVVGIGIAVLYMLCMKKRKTNMQANAGNENIEGTIADDK